MFGAYSVQKYVIPLGYNRNFAFLSNTLASKILVGHNFGPDFYFGPKFWLTKFSVDQNFGRIPFQAVSGRCKLYFIHQKRLKIHNQLPQLQQ